jgi:hypothetical protein
MPTSTIEERLSILESEVNKLKVSFITNTEPIKPWWEEIVGVFANDPAFDEAIAIGREYRKSWKDAFELDSRQG